MARKRTTKRSTRGVAGRLAGLFLLVLGIIVVAGLVTYHNPSRHGFSGLLAGWYPNAAGGLGRWAAGGLVHAAGWVGSYLCMGLLLAWGGNRLVSREPKRLVLHTLTLLCLAVAGTTLLTASGVGVSWTGQAAVRAWAPTEAAVGPFGGFLLVLAVTMGFLMLEAQLLTGNAWRRATRRVLKFVFGMLLLGLSYMELGLRRALGWAAREAKQAISSFWSHKEDVGSPWGDVAPEEGPQEPVRPRIVENDDLVETLQRSREAEPKPGGQPDDPGAVPDSKPLSGVSIRRVPEGVGGKDDVGSVVKPQTKPKRSAKALINTVRGKFTLPHPGLLEVVPESGPPVPETELLASSQILMETLQDFGIAGQVGEVHPGPVITRYEFTPGPGVRVSQILNRADDLALKLRATRIRIVAPIPGKAAVGIEVPNRAPQTIYLKRLLESGKFKEAAGPLSLALGRDINGTPVMAELSRMPHLLVAGTTGSGKSVCVNSIVTSLVMKNTPAQLRMLMIDPKMLELPMYNGIPHLLTEVVTDPRLAARALKWLIAEMERRYNLLAAKGSRNIQSYNEKVKKAGADADVSELPYVVALIDELADLMMVSGKEVEEPIARLAQMARAVGIHLIVATQRPSVDVLTGVIKANFPTRIAFQVASKTDSRTILDQNGAETLLGRGDMLFLPPGQAAPDRVHGAFVSEADTQSLVRFLKDQELPQEDMGLEDALNEVAQEGGVQQVSDPRYEEAARLVVSVGQGSASLLQRRMKVGYARAGRLVDMLEATGVVAPSEGSKPREVLMDDVRLEQMLRERDEF